jgi:hypothetical protein
MVGNEPQEFLTMNFPVVHVIPKDTKSSASMDRSMGVHNLAVLLLSAICRFSFVPLRVVAPLGACVKRSFLVMVFLATTLAHAQTSQFLFDANGNLLVQSAELNAPPQITAQPQNQIVDVGEMASFLVVATGSQPLSYEWRFNNTNIIGSTETLLLLNVSTSNEGQYSVVVSNSFGSVTSAPAILAIDSDHDGMGDSWEFGYFGNLDQNALGNFDGDDAPNRQEFLDGTDPTDPNSIAYRLLVIRDGGTVIKNPDQPIYTNGQSVTLTAIPPPNGSFNAWLGEVVTRSNSITLVMTNNKTVYARFTPIVLTWIAGNGDWDTIGNWTPNLVPGSNDTVVINSSVTVTLNTSANCADVTLGSAASPSSTLTGSGTLTVQGDFLWLSGAMSGSGRTVIKTGGTMTVDSVSGVTLTTRTLENGGTAVWTGGGGLFLHDNAVITNHPGALFHVQNAASFASGASSGRIDNAGTFRKSGNPGTTSTGGIGFNNYGIVEIQAGTLELNGSGAHSGSFDVPVGTALVLRGGPHNANGSSSIIGAGSFGVDGNATLAGLVNVTGTNSFTSGTPDINGNYICTNNTLIISGGTANFSGLISPAVVNLSAGALGGSGIVTVNNVMNWTGGEMSGNGRTIIPAGVTLNVSSPFGVSLTTRTLDNGGTIVWTGTGRLALYGAVITNRPGALFHVQNAAGFAAVGSSGRIDNAGTFRKSGNPGTTTTGGIGFNNYGTVEIQTGTLDLQGSGAHSGSFDVPAGTLVLRSVSFGTAHDANASSSITGAGNFIVSGGTVNLAGLVNVTGSHIFSGGTANITGNYISTNTLIISGGTANFSGTGLISPAVVNLSAGTLGGSSIVTVNNVMNWTGGEMSGSGRTIIPAGVTLNVATPSGVTLTTRTLDNGGTVAWTGAGGLFLFGNAVLTNRPGALFHAQNAAGFALPGSSGRIDNAGTFRKSGNTGTTSTGGLPFNNYGTVDIRSGIFEAHGYTSTPSAFLNCTLGGKTPGASHGQLRVPGTVTLNGALSVDFANGFSPVVNDTFTVLTAGTRNGSFASFSHPNGTEMGMSNTPNSVVVRALGPYFATTTLPDAMRNLGYTQQVTAVMKSAPIVYSVVSGALPEGLSFSGGGLISGIPTNFGHSVFTIQAADAGGVEIQQAFHLRVRNLPPEGLISWWRAENNALDSINTNHGVLTNGATFAAGNVGQTFAFDGVNDYVHVPDSQTLKPASVTVEAWVKFFATNGIRIILVKPLGAGTFDTYGLALQDGAVLAAICDNSGFGPFLIGPANTVTGQWYHLAFTFDDATKLQALYINGALAASGTANKTLSYDSHPLLLGADIENGTPGFFLNGQIDEASLYDRALSSNEIAAIHSAGSAGKPVNVPYFVTPAQLPDAARMLGYTQQVSAVLGTGPITYSTPSGGLPAGLDLSSNGTISGMALVAGTHSFILRATDSLGAFTDQLTTLRVLAPVAAPSGLISWWRAENNALDSVSTNHGVLTNGANFAPGNVGQAFALDGVNDFVLVPDSPSLRPSSITLEAWAVFNAPSGPVFTKPLGPAAGDSFALYLFGGTLHGFIHDANAAGVLVSSPSVLALGQWHHVAFTFDDATKEQALYVNGARVATSQSNRSIGYDNRPVLLGQDINNGVFDFPLNGRIDEAAIYKRALTAGEIAAIHDAGIAGKQLQILTPYEQWKQIYLGDPNAPDSGDPDGDGFNNLAEYTADTNPTNAASRLRITGISFTPAGIAFQWQGGTLATQYLQCAFGLSAADSWTDVFTNLPPTASPSGFTNSPPSNATQFYRLRTVR